MKTWRAIGKAFSFWLIALVIGICGIRLVGMFEIVWIKMLILFVTCLAIISIGGAMYIIARKNGSI